MYGRQPSSVHLCERLEKELLLRFSNGSQFRNFDPPRDGMRKAQNWSRALMFFQNQYANPEEEKEGILDSSQHYDFLPLITQFSVLILENKDFRIFESTTVQT